MLTQMKLTDCPSTANEDLYARIHNMSVLFQNVAIQLSDLEQRTIALTDRVEVLIKNRNKLKAKTTHSSKVNIMTAPMPIEPPIKIARRLDAHEIPQRFLSNRKVQ